MAESSQNTDHKNTEDYISDQNSPETNRRNAGILIRRMSDEFNRRKFPHLIQEHRRRSRSTSNEDGVARWRVATQALVFLRRLRGGGGGSANNGSN